MSLELSGKNRIKPDTILFITAILGSVLYISLIFNDNLWVDEAFTAALIRGNWNEVIRDTVADTLPPFYNVLGKLLTSVFGFSSLVLKLLSCIPMMLLIFFGGRKLNDSDGFRAAFLYELFLIAMPYFLHYGVEIRMYSWGVFACGMAALYFTDIFRGKDPWLIFTLFSVFAGYIHHFALVTCGMMWFILLIAFIVKKDFPQLKAFGKNLLIFIILYLPGLILTVIQIKNASSYFEMTPLGIGTLLSDIRFPFVTNVTLLSALLLLTVIFTVISALVYIKTREQAENEITGLSLYAVFYMTLLFGYGVSLLAGRSIFTARYLVPALSVFWLGAAILSDRAIRAFGDNKLLTGIIIALVAVTGVTVYMQAFREEYSSGTENMKAFFRENTGSEDAYVIHEDVPQIEICFKYYFPDLEKTGWKKAGETRGNLWLLTVGAPEKELDNAHDHGYNAIYISDFTFDRYSFSLYRLEKQS